MSLFQKKKLPPKEVNAIDNTKLKEGIANSALNILNKGEDYDELAYTKVEFGYLFNIEGHGIESLFKVITDKTIVYFAVQGAKLMRLDFSEELFRNTVDSFMEIHG